MDKNEPPLYEIDFHPSGLERIDFHDGDRTIVSFLRRAKNPQDYLVFVCNFAPTPHKGYRIGFPEAG